MTGRLVVISGPSGVGKSSVCHRLLENAGLRRVVTCTTRAPRGAEEPGKDYHFLTPKAFQDKLEAGGFLETATVHGNSYGTPSDHVEEALKDGIDLLLAIDVQGAEQLRLRFAETAADPDSELTEENLVTIFLMPPAPDVLAERLSGRGTEDDEQLTVRLRAAEQEMRQRDKYDHVVVNDKLEEAVTVILEILRKPVKNSE